MAFDFTDPNFLKTLYYFMAGAGREIGGNQGVAEAIGAPTQQMIRSQNMMDLVKTLGGEQTTPTPSGTPKATGTGEKSKITIEGSKLDDVAKALSLGADSVMIGSLLAGTRESPGEIQRMGMWPNEQLFKKYRGSASAEVKQVHGLEEKNVEGNSKLIPYKGKVERIINDIRDGVRSSMSYVNAKNITEFHVNSEHVLITQNGLIEAKPHLLL